MMIIKHPLAATLAATTAALLFAAPAAAQEPVSGATAGPTDRVNQVVVYGEDPCPASADGEIVVCGRLPEDERYRIPAELRGNPNDPRRESWTARVTAVERTGRTGTDSCSPVGLGGFTGCVGQLIDRAYAERGEARGTDWTNAIEAERRRRTEGFDEQAEAEEEAALTAERERIAREAARENADQEAAADAAPLPDPVPAPR